MPNRIAVQAYIDWQDSNDRAPKTMIKYRDVLTRFAAHCRDAGVRLMHAITAQTVDEFAVRRRRDGMAAKAPYKAAFLMMSETGMRIGEVVHLTHDDLTLTGSTPVDHIRPKDTRGEGGIRRVALVRIQPSP